MARLNYKTDSTSAFQRYSQRIYQKMDREIYRLSRSGLSENPTALRELLQLKLTIELLLRLHNCDNLDALKWELLTTFPRYRRFF